MTYFKQLKCMIAMLIVLTLVSIPQLVILSLQFNLRGEQDINKLNIGLFSQSTYRCLQKDYKQENLLSINCPIGSVIDSMPDFSIGRKQ